MKHCLPPTTWQYPTESYLNQQNIGAPFWAFAWVGGQALARYILDRPSVVEGKHIVDIGSGGGIVSIAAAMAGAEHILALDIDPMAEMVCRMNAELNGVSAIIATETADAITYDLSRFDLILVGDVCYTLGESQELAEHVRAEAAPVLFGDPGRQFMPRADLEHLAACSVPTSKEIEADDISEASVWRML